MSSNMFENAMKSTRLNYSTRIDNETVVGAYLLSKYIHVI